MIPPQKNVDGMTTSAPQKTPPLTSSTSHQTPDKIEWQALEHEHREHSTDWYWMLWIVAVAVAIGAILLDNILFAALSIVSAFVMTLFASRAPEMVTFSISHRGIRSGNILYPFSSLHSFAIKDDEEEHDGRFLLIKSHRYFAPLIIIPIPDTVSTKRVRDFLLIELPEGEMHLPFSERLMEIVGF